ncbi:MAG: hypothetical protein RIS70_4113 [Planctomycetota bacterium]
MNLAWRTHDRCDNGARIRVAVDRPPATSGASIATQKLVAFCQRLRWSIALLTLASLVAGCRDESISTDYGRRAANLRSANGTSVLASMFEKAGHKVSTWRRLSPKLDGFQSIVWAPDSFEPPSLEEREYLEGWLADKPNRTLIYIGRDYDPLPDYWSQMLIGSSADQRTEFSRRIARSLVEREESRARIPPSTYARWFLMRGEQPVRAVQDLAGPWAEGVDVRRARLSLGTTFDLPTAQDIPTGAVAVAATPVPPPKPAKVPRFLQRMLQQPGVEITDLPDHYEVLLSANSSPFVTRISDPAWNGSQLLVVANGSFTLNMPMVNLEHRKLSQRLVDACGSADRVCFLESDAAGLSVNVSDMNSGIPTKMEAFRVWPMNVLLIHLLAAGLIFCAMVFPIFGRPKRMPAPGQSDLSTHIDALGKLLAQTKDSEYARKCCEAYQQQVRHERTRQHP